MSPGGSSTRAGTGGSCKSASVGAGAADCGASSWSSIRGAGFAGGPAGRGGACNGVRALTGGPAGFVGAAGHGVRVIGVIRSLAGAAFGSALAGGLSAGLGSDLNFGVLRSVSLPAWCCESELTS